MFLSCSEQMKFYFRSIFDLWLIESADGAPMNVDDQMPFVVCWEGLTAVQVHCLVECVAHGSSHQDACVDGGSSEHQ